MSCHRICKLKQPSHEWIHGRCGFRFARCSSVLGVFWLLAITAFTGCQTSKPASSQNTAGNSSPIAKPPRHHVATPHAPAKDTKIPAPATLTTIPAPTRKEPPVIAPHSAVANIGNAPVVQPAPVTPTETAPLADGNPAAPLSKPESLGRSSLTVPDTNLNPLPPASARPTFDVSHATVSPDKIPNAVNLSRIASPAADLPAPNPPVIIRLPALDEQPPARTASPSLNIFFRPALPETASSFPANPQGLHLPSETNQISPPTIRSNQFKALPLPVPVSVSWPANGRSVAPAPGLSNWLASPAPAPQPASANAREARDNLHQKVYNFILGN